MVRFEAGEIRAVSDVIGVFWVVYQRTFGYSHGLDSMTPEFESVWMGLWRFNIVANALFFAVSIRA